LVKISKGGGLWLFFASRALQNPMRMPNMETELRSFAQEKLTQSENMKKKRQDKNFRMFIIKLSTD
jgi:hypothetical protein